MFYLISNKKSISWVAVGPGSGFVDPGTNLGTGGSHGGEGGIYDDDLFAQISDAYGSFTQPLDFGSGGASARGETDVSAFPLD